MGKRTKKKPARMAKKPKARRLTAQGTAKRKRGDLRMTMNTAVGFDVKQGKGGRWKRASTERRCKIHTVCDCVTRSDPAAQRPTYNR